MTIEKLQTLLNLNISQIKLVSNEALEKPNLTPEMKVLLKLVKQNVNEAEAYFTLLKEEIKSPATISYKDLFLKTH